MRAHAPVSGGGPAFGGSATRGTFADDAFRAGPGRAGADGTGNTLDASDRVDIGARSGGSGSSHAGSTSRVSHFRTFEARLKADAAGVGPFDTTGVHPEPFSMELPRTLRVGVVFIFSRSGLPKRHEVPCAEGTFEGVDVSADVGVKHPGLRVVRLIGLASGEWASPRLEAT